MRTKTTVTKSEAFHLEDSGDWKGKVVWGQSCNSAQGLGRCEQSCPLEKRVVREGLL